MYLPATPSRILLVKRDKIGDLLLSTSLIAHLHRSLPDAEIHLLANDYNAWVIGAPPACARVWVYPRVRDGGRVRVRAALAHLPLLRALRMLRFDWAIALNGEASPRATRRALAVRARRSVAYVDPADRGVARLSDALVAPPSGHELDRLCALLAPLGVSPPRTWPPVHFSPPPDALQHVHAWLETHALVRRRYAVLGVGARFREKQPSATQVLRWAALLHERYRIASVFVWTPGARDDRRYPGDDELAREVLDARPPGVVPFRGSVEQVAALVHEAALTIVPDSGLMHVAAASPGGVVGLFARGGGHDDPERWHPIGPRAHWIVAPSTVAELHDEALDDALESLLRAPRMAEH